MAHTTIRRTATLAVACLCLAGVFVVSSTGRRSRAFTGEGDSWPDLGASASSGHSVVVAELFTSEGCSSCPPADELLSRLVREPLDGTAVLGLGEHVDYWDHLGWKDPFSSPAFSSRQSEYQNRVFRTGSVYTPQLVVDGQFESVGSDLSAVRRAIARAAAIPKAVVDVAAWPAYVGQLSVRVNVRLSPAVDVREQADVVLALTQDHQTSDVRRGENRGRRLAHRAVVRSLTPVGSLTPPVRTFDMTTTLPVAADWNLGDIRVIGLLQERRSRRIVGAGSAPVNELDGPPSAG